MGKCNLEDADLEGADMTQVSLTGTKVKIETISNSVLKKTRLPGKIKVKSKDNEEAAPPWLLAKQEEEMRRLQRLKREDIAKQEEDKRRLRRLGIKTPPVEWEDDDE